MADTYTTNLNLKKPGYDSYADIKDLNDNFDKIDTAIANAGSVKSVNGQTGEVVIDDVPKLGGKAPEYYTNPRNLLDNSDFEIAQAGYGEMHGTKKFAADKWECHVGLVVSKVSNGLEISSTREYDGMWQYLGINAAKYSGKRMTAVMSVNGDVFAVTSTMGANQVTVVGNGATLILALAGTSPYVQVNISRVATVINWVALYEGAYTAETLPPYVAPDPVLELAKCQYYAQLLKFDVWSTVGENYTSMAGYLSFRIPVATMRDGVPDVVLPTSGLYIDGEGNKPFGGSITKTRKTGNFIEIQVYDDQIAVGNRSLSTRDTKADILLDMNI